MRQAPYTNDVDALMARIGELEKENEELKKHRKPVSFWFKTSFVFAVVGALTASGAAGLGHANVFYAVLTGTGGGIAFGSMIAAIAVDVKKMQ